MKTIEELIQNSIALGMTENQAQNYACQEIILSKIAKSPFSNKVLVKGGVLMFYITKNIRRATVDIDFDFERYDISQKSIEQFIDKLNQIENNYQLIIKDIEPLHQDDYQGKRLLLEIKDKTSTLKTKLDIGVHTLTGIEQKSISYIFNDEEEIVLRANPLEQVFAEKLVSLAKHGVLSTRYKDVFDLYYLIKQGTISKSKINECLCLLLIANKRFKSLDDVFERVNTTISNKQYIKNIETSKDKWIDVDINTLLKVIQDYINSL